MEPCFVNVALPPGQASAVVAEYEYYGVVVEPFILQVFKEEADPGIDILHSLEVSGIVGADFREVRDVRRKFKEPGVYPFFGVVTPSVGVEGPDAAHVRGDGVVYSKERLPVLPSRALVRGCLAAFVPAAPVVGGGVVVCLPVVCAVVAGLP